MHCNVILHSIFKSFGDWSKPGPIQNLCLNSWHLFDVLCISEMARTTSYRYCGYNVPPRKGGALQCILGWIDRAVSQVGLLFSGGRRGHSATNYSALCLPVRLENGWHLPSILGCCAVDILANNTWFVFEWRTSWNMEQLKRWQFVERLLGVARQWIRDLEKQSGGFGKTWKKPRKSGFENKLKKIFEK